MSLSVMAAVAPPSPTYDPISPTEDKWEEERRDRIDKILSFWDKPWLAHNIANQAVKELIPQSEATLITSRDNLKKYLENYTVMSQLTEIINECELMSNKPLYDERENLFNQIISYLRNGEGHEPLATINHILDRMISFSLKTTDVSESFLRKTFLHRLTLQELKLLIEQCRRHYDSIIVRRQRKKTLLQQLLELAVSTGNRYLNVSLPDNDPKLDQATKKWSSSNLQMNETMKEMITKTPNLSVVKLSVLIKKYSIILVNSTVLARLLGYASIYEITKEVARAKAKSHEVGDNYTDDFRIAMDSAWDKAFTQYQYPLYFRQLLYIMSLVQEEKFQAWMWLRIWIEKVANEPGSHLQFQHYFSDYKTTQNPALVYRGIHFTIEEFIDLLNNNPQIEIHDQYEITTNLKYPNKVLSSWSHSIDFAESWISRQFENDTVWRFDERKPIIANRISMILSTELKHEQQLVDNNRFLGEVSPLVGMDAFKKGNPMQEVIALPLLGQKVPIRRLNIPPITSQNRKHWIHFLTTVVTEIDPHHIYFEPLTNNAWCIHVDVSPFLDDELYSQWGTLSPIWEKIHWTFIRRMGSGSVITPFIYFMYKEDEVEVAFGRFDTVLEEFITAAQKLTHEEEEEDEKEEEEKEEERRNKRVKVSAKAGARARARAKASDTQPMDRFIWNVGGGGGDEIRFQMKEDIDL